MWAEIGSSPRAIRQTNYKWTYLFGSVCPSTGQCHALMVMDGAGWYSATGLEIPDNVSILLLPPYSPELNPVELIWRHLRQRKLSNRLYPTVDDLEAAVDEVWLWMSNQQNELARMCFFPWIESALINLKSYYS